jgi:cupin 2 domain-containing protein
MTLSAFNLVATAPTSGEAEAIDKIVLGRGIRMERIVSFGQASPDGFWCDQDMAEWVMVLSGRARLSIAGEETDRVLGPGDALFLPAHCRHRVTWTDPSSPTIWLALFVDTDLNPMAAGAMIVDENAKS